MATKTTIIEEPPVASEDANNVIAYRVGKLESAVKEGFEAHNVKLDKIVQNFAAKADVIELNRQVDILHTDVGLLKDTDARQQGSLDTTRRLTAIGLTLLAIAMSAVAVYFGVHK
jgi:hypothetical protein